MSSFSSISEANSLDEDHAFDSISLKSQEAIDGFSSVEAQNDSISHETKNHVAGDYEEDFDSASDIVSHEEAVETADSISLHDEMEASEYVEVLGGVRGKNFLVSEDEILAYESPDVSSIATSAGEHSQGFSISISDVAKADDGGEHSSEYSEIPNDHPNSSPSTVESQTDDGDMPADPSGLGTMKSSDTQHVESQPQDTTILSEPTVDPLRDYEEVFLSDITPPNISSSVAQLTTEEYAEDFDPILSDAEPSIVADTSSLKLSGKEQPTENYCDDFESLLSEVRSHLSEEDLESLTTDGSSHLSLSSIELGHKKSYRTDSDIVASDDSFDGRAVSDSDAQSRLSFSSIEPAHEESYEIYSNDSSVSDSSLEEGRAVSDDSDQAQEEIERFETARSLLYAKLCASAVRNKKKHGQSIVANENGRPKLDANEQHRSPVLNAMLLRLRRRQMREEQTSKKFNASRQVEIMTNIQRKGAPAKWIHRLRWQNLMADMDQPHLERFELTDAERACERKRTTTRLEQTYIREKIMRLHRLKEDITRRKAWDDEQEQNEFFLQDHIEMIAAISRALPRTSEHPQIIWEKLLGRRI